MRRLYLLLVIFVSVPLMQSLSVAGTVITTCGQEVDDAILVSDLDCSSHDTGPALTIRRSLTMNGFTIHGSSPPPLSFINVVEVDCDRKCEVIGPGAIVDSNGTGLRHLSRGRLTVTDLTVTGHRVGIQATRLQIIRCLAMNNEAGIAVGRTDRSSSAIIKESTITGNTDVGIRGVGKDRIKVFDSDVSGNGGIGIDGASSSFVTVILRNTTVTNNASSGIRADRVVLRESTVSANGGDGIVNDVGRRVKAVDSFITGNGGSGVKITANANGFIWRNPKVALKSTVVTGNSFSGISSTSFFAPTARLKDSDLAGNCVAPIGSCADIQSCQKLKLINTTCDTSGDCFLDGTLGLCSLD